MNNMNLSQFRTAERLNPTDFLRLYIDQMPSVNTESLFSRSLSELSASIEH